jgi:hypothetical protein
MRSIQPSCSGKSKKERMPMGEGVGQEEVVMPSVEEEAVAVEMVQQAKQSILILLCYIAMIIFSDAAMSTTISLVKRSLES